MSRLLVLAGLVLLAGCLSPPPTPPPNLDLSRWIGHPVSEVFATWGAPTRHAVIPSGQRYTWLATSFGERTLPANLGSQGGPDDRRALEQFRCRAVIETAPEGTITAARWAGQECGATP